MYKMVDLKTEVILALDVESRPKAEEILDATGENLKWVKIGLQTYLRDGPNFLIDVAKTGRKIFLDLKLHDIPNTMVKAIESLSELPVKMLTLHSTAGPEALEKSSIAAQKYMPDTKLLAVTVLTSMNQSNLNSIGIEAQIPDQVDRLAQMAVNSNIDGIVCSPLELVRLRPALPKEIKFVTPGIRPTGSATGDQKRIMTPSEASKAGADFLVIGRPILAAEDPRSALTRIQTELQE